MSNLGKIAERTTVSVVSPDGVTFKLLRFTTQVAAACIGNGLLGLSEVRALAKKIEAEEAPNIDEAKRLHAETDRLIRATLKAAMVSPRLADDDYALDEAGDSVGYMMLGDFANSLFGAVMDGGGESEVFRLSPQDCGGQT
jgi:hypothetical protein